MWARLMRVDFAAKDDRSCALRFHAQTAGSTLTSQQPDNNVVRVAVQALAAVLGGAQSLHTNAKDEALALPTETAALLALRTQQIVAHESHVTQTSDPLGGSWYLEKLTGKLEREAEAYMKNIRSMGGVLAAIDSGYIQKDIQEAAYVHQKRLEERQETVVGLNRFQEEDASPIEVLRVDLAVEKKQKERLKTLRQQRDSAKAQVALEKVGKVARGQDNLMPVIIAAVEAQATIGEISNAMKDAFGEHREKIVI
jgi:methylmalonyl-CoA mutase N-terminal domain/subunit